MFSIRQSVVLYAAGLVLVCNTLASAQQSPRQAPEGRANQSKKADSTRSTDQPSRAARPAEQDEGQRGPTQASGSAHSDADLAACLIIDSNKELALARLAQQHSQNGQVHQFAEQMIKDHDEFVQKLRQTAIDGGYSEEQLSVDRSSGPTDLRPADQSTAQSRDGNEPTGRRAARAEELDTDNAAGAGTSFISLKREIAEECVQSIRQALDQTDEAQFDIHYMGSQCMAHQGMIDTLKVFSRHASPEMQQTLDDGQQMARAHLDQAKQIKEQLKQPSSDNQQGPEERPSK